MPFFSQPSREKLVTCDSRLIRLCTKVVQVFDVTVLCGRRDEQEQNRHFNSGNSKVRYPNSKHNSIPSMAIDLAPYPIPLDWGKQWKDKVKFYELKAIMFYEADRLGVRLRWGGDWDGDGDYKDQKFDDLVHYEIVEG